MSCARAGTPVCVATAEPLSTAEPVATAGSAATADSVGLCCLMEMLQPSSGVELVNSRAILLLHVELLPGLGILPGPDMLFAEPDSMLPPGMELVQDDANLAGTAGCFET